MWQETLPQWPDSYRFNGRLLIDRTQLFASAKSEGRHGVIGALYACFRVIGGVPAAVLTDNARTVTVDHVCNLPVRSQRIVSAARWYGTTIHTCVPYDPASKGGVENAVKVAKADLVPTSVNLRAEYASFAELQAACAQWNHDINHRQHAAGFVPDQRLQDELALLHPVPADPYQLAVGQVRSVRRW